MSVYPLIVGAIVTGTGIVLEGISVAISGIQSTKVEDPTLKRTLLAAAATVGFGVLIFIISLVLFFAYQIVGKRAPEKAKGLKIAALVMAAVGLALLITGATIAGIQSNKFKDNQTVYNALRTAAVLVAVGVVLILIGYVILYVFGRKRLPV